MTDIIVTASDKGVSRGVQDGAFVPSHILTQKDHGCNSNLHYYNLTTLINIILCFGLEPGLC